MWTIPQLFWKISGTGSPPEGVLRQDRGLAVEEAENVGMEKIGARFSVRERGGSPNFNVSSGSGVGRGIVRPNQKFVGSDGGSIAVS